MYMTSYHTLVQTAIIICERVNAFATITRLTLLQTQDEQVSNT